jgi:hypothetical protein
MNFAHLLSVLLEDSRALIISVVGICINNILSGFNPRLSQLRNSLGFFGSILADISYSRWCIEGFYLSVLIPFQHIYNVDFSLKAWDYHLDELALALAMPFVLGFVFRCLTVAALMVKARRLTNA